MPTGKVKWFNNAKGYGFILPEQGGEDLFAHYSSICMDGYKTLKAGQPVEFDVKHGPKGAHAVNIQPQPTADADAPREGSAVSEDAEVQQIGRSESARASAQRNETVEST